MLFQECLSCETSIRKRHFYIRGGAGDFIEWAAELSRSNSKNRCPALLALPSGLKILRRRRGNCLSCGSVACGTPTTPPRPSAVIVGSWAGNDRTCSAINAKPSASSARPAAFGHALPGSPRAVAMGNRHELCAPSVRRKNQWSAPWVGRSSPRGSSLAQALLPVLQQRREQIADDPARPRPDLDRDRHPGRQVHKPLVHLDLRAIE
jgi:hypothetical protein